MRRLLSAPFFRPGAESPDTKSSGIGLALAKQLLDLMGGDIGFDSEVGVGGTFWIDLPVARNAPKMPQN